MRPTKASLAVTAALLACPATTIHAFHISAVGTNPSARTESTSLRAEGDGRTALGRRAVLASAGSTLAGAAAALSLGVPIAPANAVIGGASQAARVASYPDISDLEPLYELKLSVDALAAGVQNTAQWPSIQKRLAKFFKGAVLSEKNFYLGVGFQYINDIKYDDDAAYVTMDKQARFGALDACVTALERLKGSLGGNDAAAVEGDAQSAQSALASWFALIPEGDVKAVEQLFKDVRSADVDRNGLLSEEELATLPAEEREAWKKRVQKFG